MQHTIIISVFILFFIQIKCKYFYIYIWQIVGGSVGFRNI